MADRQPPEYLIRDVMHVGSAVALISAPGVGKTFVALDMAFAIAEGKPWHGRTTQQRSVAYILAEGAGGIGRRIRAWRIAHNVQAGVPVGVGVWFWDRDIQIATREGRNHLTIAMDEVARQNGARPEFIVIDTLARCFVGLDENAAQDMGRFVSGIDMLRETGATVLVLHHTGHRQRDKSGKEIKAERERGSSVLRGACDTMMILKRGYEDGDLVLTCDKQRDSEAFEPISLALNVVDLGNDETSCVVIDGPGGALPSIGPKWMQAITALRNVPEGATSSEWEKIAGLPHRTFYRMTKRAKGEGLVEQRDGKWFATKGNE